MEVANLQTRIGRILDKLLICPNPNKPLTAELPRTAVLRLSYTNGSYFAPVIILHPSYSSSQFYFLASGTMDSTDPWDYVTPDMKNQS